MLHRHPPRGFELYLPVTLYLIGLGLILVPLVVMELSKLLGLIRHPNAK